MIQFCGYHLSRDTAFVLHCRSSIPLRRKNLCCYTEEVAKEMEFETCLAERYKFPRTKAQPQVGHSAHARTGR